MSTIPTHFHAFCSRVFNQLNVYILLVRMFHWALVSCRSNFSGKRRIFCFFFSRNFCFAFEFIVWYEFEVLIHIWSDERLFPAYLLGNPKWSGQSVIGRERYLNSRVSSRHVWPLLFGFWICYFESINVLFKFYFRLWFGNLCHF